MARFNLDDYETVASRLERFWQDNPQGRVHAEMVSATDTGFIIRAEVYADREDARPVATGLAEEHWAAKGVNAVSPVENCETSAIGRALANWIYVSKTDKRPSREEMAKVQRAENRSDAKPEVTLDDKEMANLLSVIESVPNIDSDDLLKEVFRGNKPVLDVKHPGAPTTLRQAILTRKGELEVRDSA